VRCDRNDPCGNCLDQNTTCTRSRGMKRLPKRDLTIGRARSREPPSLTASNTATPSATALSYGSRLQSIDPTQLLNFNNIPSTATATAGLDNSFIADLLDDPMVLLDVGVGVGMGMGMGYELQSWMAIVPLTDAQTINRRRRVVGNPGASGADSPLNLNPNSQHSASWGRSQVLESALSVASQVLGSMEYFTDTGGVLSAEEAGQRNVPSIEFLYWMLKDIGSTKFGPFIADYFRHISNHTLKHMGLALLFNTASYPESILYTVCVNSVAYKFLNATLATESDPDLAQSLRASALLYRETAKAALQRIPLTAKPSLALLQAILCGIFLSQGIGDTSSCRELARTACRVCMDIGIGIGIGIGVGPTSTSAAAAVAAAGDDGMNLKMDLSHVSEEEYYCFMWCYQLDRNYAWKIGSPRVLLVDPETDVDPPPATTTASQLIRIYLDLAKVQDAMIPFLNEPGKAGSDESFQGGKFLLARMETVRRDIDLIKPPSPNWRGLDATSEIATLDFAYHSILTNLLHLRQISLGHTTASVPAASGLRTGAGTGTSTGTPRATTTTTATASTRTMPASPQTETAIYLDSARRNLLALITICASSDEQKTVAYLHWTILYYPITACIALFCNALATGHEGDVEILRAVSNSLAASGSLSAPIAAMRRLLVEFVRLSRGVFSGAHNAIDENNNHGDHGGGGGVPRGVEEAEQQRAAEQGNGSSRRNNDGGNAGAGSLEAISTTGSAGVFPMSVLGQGAAGVQIPPGSPWLGGGAAGGSTNQEAFGMGMGMGMGFAVSSIGQQDGAAGFDYMVNDSVFSF
ncbi:hypothetical protein BJY01DRAFT_207585, partial [Aspergillus pseudoustus]